MSELPRVLLVEDDEIFASLAKVRETG